MTEDEFVQSLSRVRDRLLLVIQAVGRGDMDDAVDELQAAADEIRDARDKLALNRGEAAA